MQNKAFLEDILKHHLGSDLRLVNYNSTAGGCINETAVVNTNRGKYFIKWNTNVPIDFFKQEKIGLETISDTKKVNTPAAIAVGEKHDIPYLILEHITSSPAHDKYWKNLGSGIAELHNIKNPKFGFNEDNYIGALPQKNTFEDDWISFFINQRLEPQLSLAFKQGNISQDYISKFQKLFKVFYQVFPEEQPALIHGDLWSGNIMCDPFSTPYLIDPAVHYANREVEIAFTMLFGGFDKRFYDAYNERLPLEGGFKDRVDCYNLYPLLVHLNLFGNSYLPSIDKIIKRYL